MDWVKIPFEPIGIGFFVVVLSIVFVIYCLDGLAGDLLYSNKNWTPRLEIKRFVGCCRDTLATWECRMGGRCSLFIVLDVLSDGVINCWCTRFFVNIDSLDGGTTTEVSNGCCNALLVKECV